MSDSDKGRRAGGREGCGVAPGGEAADSSKTIHIYIPKSSFFEVPKVMLFSYFLREFFVTFCSLKLTLFRHFIWQILNTFQLLCFSKLTLFRHFFRHILNTFQLLFNLQAAASAADLYSNR